MPIWFKTDPNKPAIKVQLMTVTFGDGRQEETTNGFMTNHPDVILPGGTRPIRWPDNARTDGDNRDLAPH